uniref:Uncharacterized protein n=1 Tax=Salmonella phage PMBT35 TaxID=3137287 RepID=A0AAU8BVD5_9VIRU
MVGDVGKVIYWIVVISIALFIVSFLAASPMMLMIVVGIAGFWWWINSESKPTENKEDKENQEVKEI